MYLQAESTIRFYHRHQRKKEQHADRETRVESLIGKTSLVLPGGTPSYHESNEGRAKGSNPFPTVLRLRSFAQDITSPNGEWDLFKKLVNLVD